jgi:hypothetical protein
MPDLVSYNASQLGTTATFSAVAAGQTYTFDNTERTIVMLLNAATTTSAVDNVFTFITPSTVVGLAVADQTVSVNGAGSYKVVGRLLRTAFNAGSKVSFTVTGTDIANLKVMVLEP